MATKIPRPRPKCTVAASSPGSTADAAHGYQYFSLWKNSVTGEVYICVDPTTAAAVWKELSAGAGGGIHLDVRDPLVTDDETLGYDAGEFWLNLDLQTLWQCMDAAVGAAVWRPVGMIPHIDTRDPNADDDITEGFIVGSLWVNESRSALFVCLDNSDGAAVWQQLGSLLTNLNDWMPASATLLDGDLACATAVAARPRGGFKVFMNGVEVSVGDGAKDGFCYFSRDFGVTALAKAAITLGDLMYWMGSVANYELKAVDRVTFLYQS